MSTMLSFVTTAAKPGSSLPACLASTPGFRTLYRTPLLNLNVGFLFISFCLHITFCPFLGMKERAEIIREEAEANIFLEIQKLEKASRVVKISGKVSTFLLANKYSCSDVCSHLYCLLTHSQLPACSHTMTLFISSAFRWIFRQST